VAGIPLRGGDGRRTIDARSSRRPTFGLPEIDPHIMRPDPCSGNFSDFFAKFDPETGL
jgi:hypothetical protein